MDFSELTNEEINRLRVEIIAEIERRESLEAIPHQISQLARAYTAAGGDPANITNSLG